jgi:glycosyltransferase involved in cell wall biosynthesis
VVFAGATHDIQDYFRAADVFVLPSRREGLPVALLEAMSCGLPCIASRLPGSTDGIITDGENGVLIEPGHAEGIVEAIARLLGDRARANALGAAARATVTSRFDGARTADRWLDVYRDVLQEMRP